MKSLKQVKSFFNSTFFFNFVLHYKKQIAILFLLNLFSSLFFLSSPYLSKLFIDNAFINKNLQNFLKISVLGAFIFIFSTFIQVVGDIIKNKINIKLKLDLSNRFIKKFYSLDLDFFQSKSVGENIYRLSDVGAVSGFVLQECPSILSDMMKLPIILGISLWINWQMTVFLLILSPLFLFHGVFLQKKLTPIYEETWRFGSNLSKDINESFTKILIVKAFGLESFRRHTYIRSLIENIRVGLKSFRWSIISSVSGSFLSKAIYGVLGIYGGWLIIRGNFSIGSYAAIMIYITQLGGLIESFSYRLSYFAQQAVSIKKFLEIADMDPKIKDMPGAKDINFTKGEIQFKNVCFGYSRDKLIFKNLNLEIPAFSWIGIAGPSGCGKTTLINLILRLYEPHSGEILLDGLKARDIRLKSLRETMSVSTQQPLLFDVSIEDNITYGLKDIDEDKIIEAAKIACVHDYIIQLPQGYNSLIGEDACKLSQGLKQRIAIARAVLRNPKILILDEATSSIDSSTEEKIFMNIKNHRQGLSTIVISHRLFSIKDADSIYFLKNEGIVEKGRHGDLLSTSKTYREFFQNQINA